MVELDGEHAGSIALTDEGGGEATVRWFVLDPEVRGNGLGRLLLGEMLAKAAEVGYVRVQLETFSELEAAAHLYREHGFELLSADAAPRWGRESITYQRYQAGPRSRSRRAEKLAAGVKTAEAGYIPANGGGSDDRRRGACIQRQAARAAVAPTLDRRGRRDRSDLPRPRRLEGSARRRADRPQRPLARRDLRARRGRADARLRDPQARQLRPRRLPHLRRLHGLHGQRHLGGAADRRDLLGDGDDGGARDRARARALGPDAVEAGRLPAADPDVARARVPAPRARPVVLGHRDQRRSTSTPPTRSRCSGCGSARPS